MHERNRRPGNRRPGDRRPGDPPHVVRQRRINVRENWYRDVWLLIITVIALIGVAMAVSGSRDARSAVVGVQVEQAQLKMQAAALSRQAATLARQASAIQQQRVETIRRGCEEQNRRHVHTIARLRLLVRRAERTVAPGALRALRASEAGSIFLLNAVVPEQNCERAVQRATRPPIRPPLPAPRPGPNPDERR